MDFTLPARLLALTVATTFAVPTTTSFEALDAGACAELEALEAASAELEGQRAGAFEQIPALTEAELAELAAAEQPALEDQRGGDVHLTDREVQIVLWTAVAIAIVFVIA